MMSPETIKSMSREATQKAAERDLVPLMVAQEDKDDLDALYSHMRAMPFLGDHLPAEYEKIDELFVDSSGMGSPEEAALTMEQFLDRVVANRAYAITSAGQFQIYVGEYKRVG